jgi:hypothetical protein
MIRKRGFYPIPNGRQHCKQKEAPKNHGWQFMVVAILYRTVRVTDYSVATSISELKSD